MLFWKRSLLKNSPWVQFCRDFKGIYSPIVWPLAADDISPQRWVPSRTYGVGSNVVSISKILTDQFFDPPTTCGFIWWVMVLAVVLGSTFKLDRKKRNYCWTKIYATGDWKPRPLDAYLMNRSFTLLDKIYWHALQLICGFFLVFNSVWKENFSHPLPHPCLQLLARMARFTRSPPTIHMQLKYATVTMFGSIVRFARYHFFSHFHHGNTP